MRHVAGATAVHARPAVRRRFLPGVDQRGVRECAAMGARI